MSAIEAVDVTKRYGEVTALDGLSLAVEAGSTFGLLGTNGAGKTTLFKLLVGHDRPDEGRVVVSGRDVADAGADIRREVGYLPERAGFPASLTAREVLQFHADMRDLPADDREARIDAVLDRVGLADAAHRAVGGYSKGMNRRLGLATALLARPRILLLDEPTAGLDPRGVAELHDIVRGLGEDDDLTVVFSSHVLPEVEALCDVVAIVHEGTLRAAGSVADLRRSLDDGVAVRLDGVPAGDREDLETVAADHGGTVRVSDRGFEVQCPRERVPALLGDLDAAVRFEGFEVHDPGLERVFERAIGDDHPTVTTHQSGEPMAPGGAEP